MAPELSLTQAVKPEHSSKADVCVEGYLDVGSEASA